MFFRTSVQVIGVIALLALFANSTTSHTDEGLPWEVTIAGFCTILVIFGAYYAQKTEVALSIVRCARPPGLHSRAPLPHPHATRSIIAILVPTYYVHNYEVEVRCTQCPALRAPCLCLPRQRRFN